MEKIKNSCDLIVVGLGIAGLYISYLASKEGKKVIGFERNPTSGDDWTGSNGSSRRYHPS